MGKESDIYAVADISGLQRVLKLHRLGRISFRDVKSTRDYLRGRSTGSWLYMARLAALKEYAVMRALHAHDFPVPEPIAQNRHTVVMSLVEGWPLVKIKEVGDPSKLYGELVGLLIRLAKHGLIHGDFNEFNILIEEHSTTIDGKEGPTLVKPIIIDFPQILSTSHPNAEFYFNRDVDCVKRFFLRRFHFEPDEPGPFLADVLREMQQDATDRCPRLDVEVEAAGFSRKMARELEGYMSQARMTTAQDEPDDEQGAADSVSSDAEASDGLQQEDVEDEASIGDQLEQPQCEASARGEDSQVMDEIAPLQGVESSIDVLSQRLEGLSHCEPLSGPAEPLAKPLKESAKSKGWSI